MPHFWTSFLAQQGPDPNFGLWPKEKPLYDPGNYCQLQGPSKDTFDAGGQPVVVRTSSSEGMWETQAECCQALWCQEQCDAFAQSPCDKASHYDCPSKCGKSPGPSSPSSAAPSGHHGHPKQSCLTQKGLQYCGQDCEQAGKDGFGCYDEETCEQVSADDAVHGRRYIADMAACCVEYTALNGDGASDETLARCANDPRSQSRVTDYKKQEPAGSGGYEDRGEFPPTAAPLGAPLQNHRSPSPQRSRHHQRRHDHLAPTKTELKPHPMVPHSRQPHPMAPHPIFNQQGGPRSHGA